MAAFLPSLSIQSCIISSGDPSSVSGSAFNSCPNACPGVHVLPAIWSTGIYPGFCQNGVTVVHGIKNQRPRVALPKEGKIYCSKTSVKRYITEHLLSAFGTHQCHRIKCELHFDHKSVGNPKIDTAPAEVSGETQNLSHLSVGADEVIAEDSKSVLNVDNGAGGGSSGGDDNRNFRGVGEDNEGDHSGNDEEEEFGPILNVEEVLKEVEARGAALPSDMADAAKALGIRKLLLTRYLDLQEAVWPVGIAIRGSSLLRDRMLADPSFLFKVLTEILIDSTCATFAEVQKRGKDFWAEFELYLADLLVGVVVDISLVFMMAPFVRFGQPTITAGLRGRVNHAIGALPSGVFEAERPGCRFSVQQRMYSYFYKGVQYGVIGFVCGIIGQGIANSIMTVKRKLKKSKEHDIPVPPLVRSAALWGVFLAISSNTRYQVVNGLERLVEGSPLAKRVPSISLAFTVGIRFANNVYGGMQFVDWARLAGVQ